MTAELGLVMPPTTHAVGRCALCLGAFRIGDVYTTIWPKVRAAFAIQVHPGCRAQLDEGDLTQIFGALAWGLEVPVRVLLGGLE